MVLLKKLDYGFNGYRVPFFPRAARSVRKRVPVKVRGNQPCPFDLLSSIADNIVLERECLPTSGSMSNEKDKLSMSKIAVKREDIDDENQMKVKPYNQGQCGNGSSNNNLDNQKCKLKEHPLQPNANPEFSVLSTSDCLNNLDSQKLVVGKARENMAHEAREVNTIFLGQRESRYCKLDCEPKSEIKVELSRDGMTRNDMNDVIFSPDNLQYSEQTYAPIAAENNVKMSVYSDQIPNTSAHSRDNICVVSRDDDDNSSGCTHPITIAKSSKPASCNGHLRTKKLLASRYQKESPALKKKQFCKSDSDGGISSESISDRPIKSRKEGFSVSRQKIRGAGKPSKAAQCRAFQSRNSQVKLRIKSFTVPELFIDIPETSTVGSLKRTVLEAVTSLLGSGLRVGVLVQGKKVKDDRKTLMQTGISHVHTLDSVDFTLEPSPTKTSRTLIPGDSFTCDEGQPLARYSSPSTVVQQSSATGRESHLANVGNDNASDHDSAPSPIGTSIDQKTADSSALVAVTPVDSALVVKPLNQKGKRFETAQRRIRRPFSVVEVETLVQAVEKLGTGRWRDVKMHAFDDAEHRTYVDLKDKWKTLVHTARISPQQRRGEPVPQELLDRVLTAHAHWSQQ